MQEQQLQHTQKILIVEDESIVALDLSRRLTNLGYTVTGMAPSGKRALELVKTTSPNIILMDIHIKGNQDGIEVANQINQLYQIPIIFLTAYSEDTTLTRASETRPYGYILKPFSERELHVAIQIALERHGADLKLKKQETHLKLALDAANLGTWEMETASAPIIMGYSPSGDLTPLTDWEGLFNYISPQDKPKIQLALDQLRTSNEVEQNLEFEVKLPDQGHRWYKLFGKSFNGPEAQHRVVGILQDITEHHRAEEQLKQAATAFRCSSDGIVVLNKERLVESVNHSFCRISGLEQDACIGKELDLLSTDALGQNCADDIWTSLDQTGSWQGEASLHQPNSKLIHTLVNIGKVPDLINNEAQYVVVISDVTPMRNVQKKLSHIAYFDSLTGLPNRNMFRDRLEMCLAKARRNHSQFGVLFLDLDHFKQVNDTLGHQMGDKLLISVALRLRAELRTSDTLCRIGGDEFIVISDAIDSVKDLENLSEKILQIFRKPIQLGNVEVIPGVSIGICIYPDHTQDLDEMIKMADTAMYAAKSQGRKGYAVYQPDMSEHVAQYFTRDQELRQALKHDQLRLHYQPQYDSRCGDLVGLEALIRWQHPNEGLLGAADIIPFAESSALIVDIGRWVLDESFRQLRDWIKHGYKPVRLSINISARQLEDRNFAHVVDSIATHHEVPLSLIELEVTESCLQNSNVGVHNLRRLKQLGATISIDDFGTGYSCMSSLKTLPITALKIDRCFIQHIQDEANDRAIANAIIALSKQLNLRTTAEGVETQAQADLLRQAGCDEFQGFLYSKPLAAELITQYLALSTESTDPL